MRLVGDATVTTHVAFQAGRSSQRALTCVVTTSGGCYHGSSRRRRFSGNAGSGHCGTPCVISSLRWTIPTGRQLGPHLRRHVLPLLHAPLRRLLPCSRHHNRARNTSQRGRREADQGGARRHHGGDVNLLDLDEPSTRDHVTKCAACKHTLKISEFQALGLGQTARPSSALPHASLYASQGWGSGGTAKGGLICCTMRGHRHHASVTARRRGPR